LWDGRALATWDEEHLCTAWEKRTHITASDSSQTVRAERRAATPWMLLQVPSRVKAMDAIPRNAMGKVNKKTLVAVFDDPSP